MKRILVALALAGALASPAYALDVGAKAPDFNALASMGGKDFQFSLDNALKKGPVVLYFYPAAFTKNCTIEAHTFADAMDKFHAMGATVIGVSADDIKTLDKFSVSACRSKFAVAADPNDKVINAYDALNTQRRNGRANRISYVIAPDHTILFVHPDKDPVKHVTMTMAVVEKWHAAHMKH